MLPKILNVWSVALATLEHVRHDLANKLELVSEDLGQQTLKGSRGRDHRAFAPIVATDLAAKAEEPAWCDCFAKANPGVAPLDSGGKLIVKTPAGYEMSYADAIQSGAPVCRTFKEG
jgi:hypothetical protein